jgi:hypothetical protein
MKFVPPNHFGGCERHAGGWPSRACGIWWPSANVKEHKDERSLERLVDMEVSRKEVWDFGGVSRKARRTTLPGKYTKTIDVVSKKILELP